MPWYVSSGGADAIGPLDDDEVRRRLHEGTLGQDALACEVGGSAWVGLSTLPPFAAPGACAAKPAATAPVAAPADPASTAPPKEPALPSASSPERTPSPSAAKPVPAKQKRERVRAGSEQDGTSDRYANLLSVSASLRGYGSALKVVGYALGFVGFVAATQVESRGVAFGVVLAGAVLALVFHVLGTLIAAFGETLLALSDIATNTAPGAKGQT